MIDPVDVDLNRHLREVEQAESRAEAEQAKVDEWMTDKKRVREALDRLAEEDLSEFLEIVAEAISNQNPEQRNKAEARAIGWLEDGVRQLFDEGAAAAVDKDEQDALDAEGEARAERIADRLADDMPGDY